MSTSVNTGQQIPLLPQKGNHKPSHSLHTIQNKGMSGDRGPGLVTEKNKGLHQAFASLQQAALPPNTVQVGNMLHQLNENSQGNKRG